MFNILAIDFGTKRVGIAVSRASLAEPLVVLENNQDLFKNIKRICAEEKINKVIVGLSENKMAEMTKAFTLQLEQELGFKVEFIDETLSSQEVLEKVKQIKKKKRNLIDHYAAAELLQRWQDSRN